MTRVLQLVGLPVYKEDKSEGREGRETPSRPPLYRTPSGPESLQPLARCGPSCKDSVREDIVSLPYALIPLSLRTPFRRQSIVSYPLPGHVLYHMFCHLLCHIPENPSRRLGVHAGSLNRVLPLGSTNHSTQASGAVNFTPKSTKFVTKYLS